MCTNQTCKDPNQCQSHEKTREELRKLREENQKFRKELDDLKDAIDGLKELESTIKDIYARHKHPIIHSIMKFFKGGKEE